METNVVAQEVLHYKMAIPTFALLLIFVAVVGLIYVASKFSGPTLAMVLAGGFLLCGLLGYRSVPLNQVVETPVVQSNMTGPIRAGVSQPARGSTEAMWEHLHRPRIVLEGGEKPLAGRAEMAQKNEVERQGPNMRQPRLTQLERTEVKHEDPPSQTPLPRPSWVDNPPKRVGNVYRVVVASGGYQTEEECYLSLEPELVKVVKRRLEQLAGSSRDSAWPATSALQTSADSIRELGQLDIGMDSIWRDICTESWVEKSEASFGEMQQVHVLMEFTAAQDERLKQALRRYQRSGRIAGLGTVAGSVVAGLMLLYGLLQADNMTKGYYSKRLFFGVPAVIIGLALLFLA